MNPSPNSAFNNVKYLINISPILIEIIEMDKMMKIKKTMMMMMMKMIKYLTNRLQRSNKKI
jgi:hypothetical protein